MIYYVFFWVFPRRLIVVCRRFGTLYRFHLQGLVVKYTSHPALEDGTDRGFRNVGIQLSDAGETPKRIHNGITLHFTCQHHSAKAPYSSPSTCCFYRKDKSAKSHKTFQKSSRGNWIQKYFHFSCFAG